MSKEYYEEHKSDYFDYKGVRYYAGTKFKMKVRSGKIEEVVFVRQAYKAPECIEVNYRPEGYSYSIAENIKKENLDNVIIEMIGGDYLSEFERKKHYLKESEVPEIVYGWVMYIFIMCLLVIFKHAWAGWIAATIFFFRWRKKKLKEAYYYD